MLRMEMNCSAKHKGRDIPQTEDVTDLKIHILILPSKTHEHVFEILQKPTRRGWGWRSEI